MSLPALGITITSASFHDVGKTAQLQSTICDRCQALQGSIRYLLHGNVCDSVASGDSFSDLFDCGPVILVNLFVQFFIVVAARVSVKNSLEVVAKRFSLFLGRFSLLQ